MTFFGRLAYITVVAALGVVLAGSGLAMDRHVIRHATAHGFTYSHHSLAAIIIVGGFLAIFWIVISLMIYAFATTDGD